jgi:hypothetical protein
VRPDLCLRTLDPFWGDGAAGIGLLALLAFAALAAPMVQALSLLLKRLENRLLSGRSNR